MFRQLCLWPSTAALKPNKAFDANSAGRSRRCTMSVPRKQQVQRAQPTPHGDCMQRDCQGSLNNPVDGLAFKQSTGPDPLVASEYARRLVATAWCATSCSHLLLLCAFATYSSGRSTHCPATHLRTADELYFKHISGCTPCTADPPPFHRPLIPNTMHPLQTHPFYTPQGSSRASGPHTPSLHGAYQASPTT